MLREVRVHGIFYQVGSHMQQSGLPGAAGISLRGGWPVTHL